MGAAHLPSVYVHVHCVFHLRVVVKREEEEAEAEAEGLQAQFEATSRELLETRSQLETLRRDKEVRSSVCVCFILGLW